jgi:hypothetical protein
MSEKKKYYQKKNIGPFQFFNDHIGQWCLFMDGRINATSPDEWPDVPKRGRGHLKEKQKENEETTKQSRPVADDKSRAPRVGLF